MIHPIAKTYLAFFLVFVVQVDVTAVEPVKIIFDTDIDTDCDDAGALAVLHALAGRGEAEILAVVTNRRGSSTASAAACDVINTFYGRPDIPIGTDKDGAKFPWNSVSSYTPALRDEFPHDALVDDDMPNALPLYRKTLAAAADHSVATARACCGRSGGCWKTENCMMSNKILTRTKTSPASIRKSSSNCVPI